MVSFLVLVLLALTQGTVRQFCLSDLYLLMFTILDI